jgi:hypothetical protein
VKAKLAAALVVAGAGFAACNVQVTPDGTAYAYTVPTPGTVVISAPSTTGSNDREFLWSSTGLTESNSTACGTFTMDNATDQPGVAFRVQDLAGVTTGITVTQNIYGYVRNQFNFHTWDTSRSGVFAEFGSTTINALPEFDIDSGESICAQVTGNVIQFVVWLPGATQPPWGDPTWGGQATLPTNAPTTGQTGFYAGHVPAGDSMTYTNLTVDGATNNPIS